jgi:hypothetical protein
MTTIERAMVCLDCSTVFGSGETKSNACPSCTSAATTPLGNWLQERKATESIEIVVKHIAFHGQSDGESTIIIPPALIRAYFAGCALQGLLANPEIALRSEEQFADASACQADAMMERLPK